MYFIICGGDSNLSIDVLIIFKWSILTVLRCYAWRKKSKDISRPHVTFLMLDSSYV